MARSRTPPSSLRRRTLSPEDMSYLSTGASVFNSTLPPQEVGIGEPGPSTRPGRMAGGLAAESMLLYEGARPTFSSMSQTHTRTSHALRDSSTPESRVQNAKRDLSKPVALSPPAPTDGHPPNAQTRPQLLSQVTSTTTTPAHSLEPTQFVFGNPLTPAAFEARLKNSPRSEPTRNTQGGSSKTRRTEGASASSSRSQTSRTSPLSKSTLSRPYPERSLSPEIPVYVPVPSSLPKRIHGRGEPTDEHGLPLVSGKTYFIGAPPPHPRPVTPQLDRSPISAYRSATSRGRGRGKGKRVSTGRPRGRPRKKPLEPLTTGLESLSSTTTVGRTGRPRGRPRKKPLEPLTTGLEPLSATTTMSRTGRPRGRPRKKPLELLTKGPDLLTSTTMGVPVGYVPVHGLAFQGSVQPYYSSTLSHWPNANTNMISQSTAVEGKGKMPAHYAQDDVFGASPTAPSTAPRELSSTNPVVSETPDADLEWYLDMATVTWRKRPRQTLPAGVGPSSQAPAPERTTILPAPHSTSSLPSKARTPPRARSPSDPPSPEADAPSPTPSNLSLRSIPFVQVEPLKSRLRVRQGLQSHASIVSSEPSSSYRRSPSIVPDSEEEQEGESENQGSEGVEGVRAVEDSRLGSLTPSIPAHAHAAVDVTVPELLKGVNSRGPGFDQAHEEDVTQRQITGIGAAAAIEEPNASSTSGSQLPTGISEVDHVVQTVHVSEFQNRDGLFTSLKEAIITSSKASPPTAAQAQERPRLEFSGCYSVLIDPATVLNGEVVDGVASTLASEIGMMFRRVEKPTTAQTQQQDPTRGVITQYECMCGGLRGPVGLPSPPPTSESDVQNYDSASCGGKISIGVADIRAGFMRGMKVTVCARHP